MDKSKGSKRKIMPDKSNVPKTSQHLPSTSGAPFRWPICRLCESNDGPFINIFDSEKTVAEKVTNLLPFLITENDDLPHKICFRCSAKIEELYEFIEKCVKTQTNLCKRFGKNSPIFSKTKSRILWEEQLNKSNVNNDDLCHALIKTAMERMKSASIAARKLRTGTFKPSLGTITEANKEFDDTQKGLSQPSLNLAPNVSSPPEIKNEINLETPPSVNTRSTFPTNGWTRQREIASRITFQDDNSSTPPYLSDKDDDSDFNIDKAIKEEVEEDSDQEDERVASGIRDDRTAAESPQPNPKPFELMDHVTPIKVHGVGTLFQCQLCNRNFLKHDVLVAHGCNAQSLDLENRPIVPSEPEASSVKFISTEDSKTSVRNDNTVPEHTNSPPENNNNVPKETADVPVARKYKPGPKSRVQGPACVRNAMIETPKVNPGPVAGPSTSKDSGKRPITENKSEIPAKTRKVQPPVELSTLVDHSKPYPVGMVQTLPHNSTVTSIPAPTGVSRAKKRSCTVIQTSNQNKLRISTKPRRADVETARKPHTATNLEPQTSAKQPSRVTAETATTSRSQQYFTIINVDPSVQPSYVLPTDNTAQERNSNAGDDQPTHYTCHICNERFTRKQKLKAHGNSHYAKTSPKYRSCSRAGPSRKK